MAKKKRLALTPHK